MTQRARPSFWSRVGTQFLPFADAASDDLPLGRLLRLALFQLSVGMAAVLLTGTLNRVMILELGLPASLVALMVALPLVFAPLRALMGFRSDHHRSALGWRRVPYIWFGTLMQFGGLALLPFALLVMTSGAPGPATLAQGAAALSFLLVGAGMHMTQTAGLALATDLAPEADRPRVVALLYVMLLAGMLVSALVIGRLLADFTPTRLVQVVQAAGVVTLVLNIIALWKQEARRPASASELAASKTGSRPAFLPEWRRFVAQPGVPRMLAAVALGAAAFSMQDVLLEPYGGQALGLSVGATTSLTALWAAGMLAGFGLSARMLARGFDPHRLAGFGCVVGLVAFPCVIFAAPAQSVPLLGVGATLIGFGAGLFSVGTLTAAMGRARTDATGLSLGAWGAVQATAAGIAIAIGAGVRDTVSHAAVARSLGNVLADPATGYTFVYCVEIILLLGTLIALGPLVRGRAADGQQPNSGTSTRFGLSEFPI